MLACGSIHLWKAFINVLLALGNKIKGEKKRGIRDLQITGNGKCMTQPNSPYAQQLCLLLILLVSWAPFCLISFSPFLIFGTGFTCPEQLEWHV